MFRKERYYEPEDNDDSDRIDDRVSELMKDEYDPNGDDVMIERAIKLIEAGQF